MRISRTKNEFARRIGEFARQLSPNSLAIIVSNPERVRSNDTEHQYRQSSNVLYLNGFPEPESALVITNFGGRLKLTMFVQPKDPKKEVWTGIRIGVDGAKANYLADQALTIDKFGEVVGKLLRRADNVYYKFGNHDELDEQFRKIWTKSQATLHNPETIIHQMRLVKSPAELATMQIAADISAQAHRLAMMRCRPGMAEYQLKATLENEFTDSGADAPAYGTIVASGNNACVLHYTSNRGTIEDGHMVLIDAACEYGGYASDITRTFPANGKFTDAQREIYELVLKAQAAAIRAARPGKTIPQVHSAAAKVLRRGLVELGILPPEMATAKNARKLIKAAKEAGELDKLVLLTDFFMHGTSHMMGLDVHDVGRWDSKGKERKLLPGMVFTVEPGLYINASNTRVPERYRGIGVRIEDDVVVTDNGCEVLTHAVPKSVAEIEDLMARTSV